MFIDVLLKPSAMIDAERVSRNDAGRRQHEASRETKAAKSVPWCLSKLLRKVESCLSEFRSVE